MSFQISRVSYFYATIDDQPGEGYKLLSHMAELGVHLLAFNSIPIGPMHTQLTIFPENPLLLTETAKKAGLELEGPHPALMAQGQHEFDSLARVLMKLAEEEINVYASHGVKSGKDEFGYILYLREEQFEKAAKLLGL